MLDFLGVLWPNFSALLKGGEGGLSAFVVGFLLILFSAALIYMLYQNSRVNRDIKLLEEKFREVESKDLYLEQRAFEQDLENLPLSGGKRAVLEYIDSLMSSAKEKKIYTTIEPHYIFNYRSLAENLRNNRLLTAMPSTLVALGVLGTFLGLTSGLQGIDIHSDEIEVLKQGIGKLVGGVSLAFQTSIWGVFLSLVLSNLEKLVGKRIDHKIKILNHSIIRVIPVISPEKSLHNISESSSESREALQELHEKLGSTMQKAIKGLSEDLEFAITSALNNVMKPAIDSLVGTTQDHSVAVMEDLITKFTEGIQESGAQQAQEMRVAGAAVNDAAQKMGSQLQNFIKQQEEYAMSFSQQEEKRQDLVNEQLDTLKKQYGEFLEEAKHIYESEKTFKDEILSKYAELAQELKTAVTAMGQSSQYLDNSSNQLGLLSKNIKETGELFQEGLIAITENIRTSSDQTSENILLLKEQVSAIEHISTLLAESGHSLGKTADLANQGFARLGEEQKQFLAGIKQEFSQLSMHLSEELRNLKGEVNQWLIAYGEQVNEQITDRFREWNEETTNFANNMHSTVAAIAELVDEIEMKSGRSN